MILHVVLIKPKPALDPEALRALRVVLDALPQRIPGIRSYHFGPNISPEELGRGYEYGFVMEFEHAAARDAYLPHPEHVKVHPLMDEVAAEVLVFDIEA